MSQPPPGAFPPGTKLKVGSHDITIKSYISAGGFAHVYVVRSSPADDKNDTACLKRVLVPDKIHLNLLRAEVDAMKRLKGHPNIVKYIDSHAERVPDGNGAYEVLLLMEYCSGNGLIDFMNARLREQLTESEILKIMFDVTHGLSCMHYLTPALIHRDLKIENVLISADGSYKLCDFGSASPVLRPPKNQQEFHILQDDIQRNTTAQYRAPEMIDIARGFPIDEKSDIWALGVFLYKLCYYTTPFEREGQLAILHARFQFPQKKAYSARLKRIISLCLAEDPRNRPNVYQVLKEVSAMRGVEVPTKDIYSGQNVLPPSKTQTANHSAPQGSVKVAADVYKVANDHHQISQKKSLPEIKPMYRGRPPKTNTSSPSLTSSSPSSSSKSNSPVVFSDPFAFLDKDVQSARQPPSTVASKKAPPQPPQRPQRREVEPPPKPVYSSSNLDDNDIESRFPSVEELSSLSRSVSRKTASSGRPLPKQSSRATNPGSENPAHRDTSAQDIPKLSFTETEETLSPRPRSVKPRPVSMYARVSNAPDSLFSMSGETGSRESLVARSPSTSAFLASRNVSDSSSSGSSLDIASQPKTGGSNTVHDSLVPEDRDALKVILTGLSERSVNLEFESNNHIDSNVDFLRTLDNEGHSLSRAPSAADRRSGQYNRPSMDDVSGARKVDRSTSQSSRHSKKNSISSIKSMFSDAVKSFDPSAKDETDVNGNQKFYTREVVLEEYDRDIPSRHNTGGSISSLGLAQQSRRSISSMRSQRTSSYGRQSEEVEQPLPARTRTSSSIQDRIHNFLNRKHSPPPRRTAEGYGKYTDTYQQSASTSALANGEHSGERRSSGTRSVGGSARSSTEFPQSARVAMPPPSRPASRVRTPVGHRRQLSDISSSSAASDKKTPPTKPRKPVYLQSPNRAEDTITRVATASTDAGGEPHEDWENNFNQRFPSLSEA